MLVLGLAFIPCYAQTQAQPDTQTRLVSQRGTSSGEADGNVTNSASPSHPAVVLDPEMLLKQMAAMEARIAQLEAELKGRTTEAAPAAVAVAPAPVAPAPAPAAAKVSPAVPVSASAEPGTATAQTASEIPAALPAKTEKIAPFSDWDWTWLNGNPRNKDVAFDSKFFTPEIRADVTYTYDFNKPIDDSMGGSSELFRSNEIQLEQLGVGGDFHYDNVRARLLTDYGMYSTATPRNDQSPGKGQWNLAQAYYGLAEAYGGYHLNALHGINLDAGLFPSYVGLFSFYNFDNWAYQPSYVSSNTPWFFVGIRVQVFPTAHLKFEPWFINGWQSYGSSNSRKGLGGQIKWTPKPWLDIISNNYGLGHDDLYIPNRSRIHTDNSVEIKYYDKPAKFIDKMAFSFTGDLGCEFGPTTTTAQGIYVQGVGCLGNTKDKNSVGGDHFGAGINPKQSFVGWMLYNRTWFKKDKFGLTVGGGQINNPGRYLVLVPPINGETAPSAALNSPYFSFNPSDPFKAWDSSITFDYMPRQWLTFRMEYDYRHANVPYWSGHGGITPPNTFGFQPGTNNGYPQFFACNDGTPDTTITDTAALAATFCGNGPIASGGHGGLWTPDLRRDESLVDIDWMIKF
jgi:hypothetical protein